ncbi:hypothetical protein CYMTET_21356 [Cymbomonas tetramitiformis]|uniref:Uncharacterized protein n=1 Tax=Cymbomonas tetramitiformis TaxID=36881 RepID=A0AAE0G252_9CHLO|nr:hypothetical protein CYMTET_21356 [Cymbomonas tetramitiformis]|eukprot:gene25630-31338_t
MLTDYGLSVSRSFTAGGQDWALYQSPNRYFEQLLSIPRSVVFRRLATTCLPLTLWAACIEAASETWPEILDFPVGQPFQFVGGAISLLLVFRTNSAYGRFNAARNSWADVTCHCRNLARKVYTWFPSEDESDMRERAARILCALPWALKARVQGYEGTEFAREQLTAILGRKTIEHIWRSDGRTVNVSMLLLREFNMLINELNEHGGHPIYQLLMDNDLTNLQSQIAKQDRIISTPTPLSYTRHTSRSLMVWLILLPFSYSQTLGWEVVPTVFLISYILLGIDDIGIQIEYPFTILPLKEICEEIEGEILQEVDLKSMVNGVRQES